MKILATTNAPFEFTPPEDVAVVGIDENEPVPPEHLDADAAILQGWTSPAASQLAREATHLRWVQTLAAGPDGVLAAGFPASVTITNGRGLHDLTVSETAVALALAGVLQFPAMLAAQRAHHWDPHFGRWRTLRPEGQLGSLIDTEVLVWGFGAIGQHTARLFTALGARVRGVARSAGERAGFEVFSDADLATLLPQTDVLVMVLPATPDTYHALDADRLALLPAHAWLVNVGRGTTVDPDALAAALTAGRLGGAALDVVEPEPYPPDGPLWSTPNTILVPHMAGGVAHGSDALFNDNLARLRAGRPLRNAVER
ncbi:NAD(P)-dependent oxidoreductase [Propioniciclava sp.]|uniref:NAD(P)-dependent oxidoreductase n=1 Tax=Propioniciclava sp. TaxID=2038686 RepID=UPI00260E95EF|nr:NAD(P)-dependent oxidoreductase [Propioniciclava sp.]